MEFIEVIKEIDNRKQTGNMIKKRVTCIHCGRTWIEYVGVIVGRKEGFEDICLHIGTESENCFGCRWRSLKCENCNTNDVYEITFPKLPREISLSFKTIKKVANHSVEK